MWNDKRDAINGLHGPYIERIDSLRTMVKYLDAKFDANQLPLNGLNDRLQHVTEQLNIGNSWQNLAQENLSMISSWANSLTNAPTELITSLKAYQQNLVTYKQQFEDWKSVWNEPARLEKLALHGLQKLPGFQKFMEQNSELAALFGRGSGGNSNPGEIMPDMQSRQNLMQQLQTRFGTGNAETQAMPAMVQEQMEKAMGSLQDIKGKVEGLKDKLQNGTLGNAELSPAEQESAELKAKTFGKRIKASYNFQSGGGLHRFPAINDAGFSIGYQIAPRATVGIGGAIKFGLGESWRKIEFSHQGMALRSFFDWRISAAGKPMFKDVWLTAGYEMNLWSGLAEISDTANVIISSPLTTSAWTPAGLAGITKKIKKGKKEMQVQLLWQFAPVKNRAIASPILFRWGKSF